MRYSTGMKTHKEGLVHGISGWAELAEKNLPLKVFAFDKNSMECYWKYPDGRIGVVSFHLPIEVLKLLLKKG